MKSIGGSTVAWNYRNSIDGGNSQFAFGRDENGLAGGDNIEIFSPTPDIINTCNAADQYNDISPVIRVTHAGRALLLPGDAESPTWSSMVAAYGQRLKSDFLKASHRKRDSGYHMEAVRIINPLLTVVSVGEEPSTDASSKYRGFCPRVASTRFYGNIKLRMQDDGSWQWIVQHNAGQ